MFENISSKTYHEGLYGLHKFNKYDLFLRKNLGLYASQFVIKDALPLVHRQFANKESLEIMALLDPSQVLLQEEMIPEFDSYFVLYLPIAHLNNQNQANLSAKKKKQSRREGGNYTPLSGPDDDIMIKVPDNYDDL